MEYYDKIIELLNVIRVKENGSWMIYQLYKFIAAYANNTEEN